MTGVAGQQHCARHFPKTHLHFVTAPPVFFFSLFLLHWQLTFPPGSHPFLQSSLPSHTHKHNGVEYGGLGENN